VTAAVAAVRAVPGRGYRIRAVMRRRVAPTAGLAFLLAGGAVCVRVTAVTLLSDGEGPVWLFTGAACVLAGVALLLIALPKFVPPQEGTPRPDPATPRG
jgi:hypothetical protein